MSTSLDYFFPSLLLDSYNLPNRLDDFKIKGQIGKGGFGVVFHVEHTTDKGEYALKIIRLSDK